MSSVTVTSLKNRKETEKKGVNERKEGEGIVKGRNQETEKEKGL